MTNSIDSSLFLPINTDGKPDCRFKESLARIYNNLGERLLNELIEFNSCSHQLQKGYAQQGLSFAVAVFKEASYLDLHHRFDEDNRYGYKSKVLRKQAQQTLERIGFSKKNTHKLVSTAQWLTKQVFSKEEKKWFEALSVSHLYELSRMSQDAFNYVKDQVSYPEFYFSAGQQEISVRQLEDIRRVYTDKEIASKKANTFPYTPIDERQVLQQVCVEEVLDVETETTPELSTLVPAADTDLLSNKEMVEQLTNLVDAIDWSAVGSCQASRVLLSKKAETLTVIAALAAATGNQFCFNSPLTTNII